MKPLATPTQSTAVPETSGDVSQRPRGVTVETVLWAILLALALALRLSKLDAAPLNAREAQEAMSAWRAVTGQGMSGTGYSPLLFTANALLFGLCGASDVLARLWPALFGSVLVLAPLLFRQRVGRTGALAAGICLALSPTALFASRQLDGAVIAVTGGLVFLGGLVRFFDKGKHSWLTLAAVGLALAVTAGSAVYGVLLPLTLAGLGLYWAWPDETTKLKWVSVRPHLGRMVVVCLLVGLALATALIWNPAGLSATGDLLAAWLARFTPVSSEAAQSYASPMTLVVVYESLPVLLGIAGLVWALRRGRRLGVLLGLWAGLAALLLTLMPSWMPLDVLWVVLPLALLGGIAVEALVQDARARQIGLGEWLHALVVLVLWAYVYLRLARYGRFGDSLDLLMVALTFALQVLLVAIFTLTMAQGPVAIRSFALGSGAALLLLTISVGWGAAHVRPADPRELLVREPTDVGVRELVRTLREISWRETGTPTTLPFTLEISADDSVLAWYLRDFGAARQTKDVESLSTVEVGPVLVTSRREWSLGTTVYIGQDFVLQRSWQPQSVRCVWNWPPQCRATIDWLLYRDAPAMPLVDHWGVLWMQQDYYE